MDQEMDARRILNDEQCVIQSGILLFERSLEKFLTFHKGQVKLHQLTFEIRNIIRRLQQNIHEQRVLLNTEIETLKARIFVAEESLRQLDDERQYIVQRIQNFRDDIKQLIRRSAKQFYRDTAKKVSHWVEKCRIQEPVSLFSADITRMQSAVERVINELTSQLNSKVESQFATWQCEELQPLLKRELEYLMLRLDEEVEEFLSQLNEVRFQVSKSLELELITESKGAEAPSFGRVLTTTNGHFLISFAPEGIEAIFNPSKLLNPLVSKFSAIAASAFITSINPWILIPTVLTTSFIQGFLYPQKTNEKIKNAVSEKYTETIHNLGDQQSDKIANAVAAKLIELQNDINQGLSKEIQIILY